MSKKKKILILCVTGQDGSFMARLALEKKCVVHGVVRKSATGNLINIIYRNRTKCCPINCSYFYRDI